MFIDLLNDNLTILLSLLFAPWFILALFATFSDSCVGYIDEWLLRRLKKDNTKIVRSIDAPGRLILISGLFGFVVSLCALVVILSTKDTFTLQVPWHSFRDAFLAGVFEVLWIIPYFYALNRGGVINVTPLFQSIPIFSLIIGLLFFNEIPIFLHICATFIIIAGALLLNYSPSNNKTDIKTLSLMTLASIIISLGYFFFKDATLSGNFVAAIFANGLGMGTLSLLIYIFWQPYREQFNDFISNVDFKLLWIQGGNEALYALHSVANQLAIVLGPSVMVVSAFNAFHPIFTLIIGGGLALSGSKIHQDEFKGKLLQLKIVSIILIAFGTLLMAF